MNIMKVNTQGFSLESRIIVFGLILKELLIFLWDTKSGRTDLCLPYDETFNKF